ncbi:MOSC domain-containing protein YiiM [Jatrophihabitans endophyticus]|uniref:MOSC domain-containing protein YiiM n=1 Tax=Jatrophihabitans endophyticus TaxID=1206085 RepID=A0A1M5ML40_9ACTN|nr:MOSC domain-containing protein [Jatrophihabitans endophyticus]SHG78028.1 MOSC domain-containing protein YiiM [Jatrophihabitans endophyticus]
MLVRSVNVARDLAAQPAGRRPTGFGKVPVSGPVEVREPGPKRGGLGSGLVGDRIGNQRHHGGTDQAVYAFAREVLDAWEQRLGRMLPDGAFGENLTTVGVDVDGALVGERWRIGDTVVLQVTNPRIPCATFRGRMDVRGWTRRFTEDGRSGAYLRVVTGGVVRSGDAVTVLHRPDHDVTVGLAFRAVMGERELLPRLRAAGDDLPAELRRRVTRPARAASGSAPRGPAR